MAHGLDLACGASLFGPLDYWKLGGMASHRIQDPWTLVDMTNGGRRTSGVNTAMSIWLFHLSALIQSYLPGHLLIPGARAGVGVATATAAPGHMVTAAEGYHHSCVIQVRARAAIGAVWIQPKVQGEFDTSALSDLLSFTLEVCGKAENWIQVSWLVH